MSARNTTLESRLEACQGFEDEAVAAERAFAIRAAYDGIPAAFLAVLAEDSIICGPGPEPGRPAYKALPKDHPGRLLWEPAIVAASGDGTLAFTAGPYRLLDNTGQETSAGAYLSVWRRNAASGQLELVLDFGAKRAEFPELGMVLKRLSVPGCADGTGATEQFLCACVDKNHCPPLQGALCLGRFSSEAVLKPSGLFCSRDGGLGVLWGSRGRSAGAFALIFGAGHPEPVPLAAIHA